MKKRFVSVLFAVLAFSVFFTCATDVHAAKDDKKSSSKKADKDKKGEKKEEHAKGTLRERRLDFNPVTMIDWEHQYIYNIKDGKRDPVYGSNWYVKEYKGESVFISINGAEERNKIFKREDLPYVSMYQIHKPETRLDYLADKRSGWKEKKDPKFQEIWPNLNNTGNELTRAFWIWGMTGRAWKDREVDKWLKVNFSFRPRKDGYVSITIGHEGFPALRATDKAKADINKDYYYRPLVFAGYANFKAEGTTLENPNFSTLSGWGIDEKTAKDYRIELRNDSKAPGGRYIYTCQHLNQLIKVQKDKKVTISFYVRYFDYYLPNENALDRNVLYY